MKYDFIDYIFVLFVNSVLYKNDKLFAIKFFFLLCIAIRFPE